MAALDELRVRLRRAPDVVAAPGHVEGHEEHRADLPAQVLPVSPEGGVAGSLGLFGV